jgi:type I restriction enzyme S subunit
MDDQENSLEQTEIGLIPEGWEIRKIGECCRIVKKQFLPSKNDVRPYIGLEHIEQQNLRLTNIGSSRDVESNKFEFKSGQILFGKLRPYFRKVYLPKFDGVCSTDIWVIEAKASNDNVFFFYFFADERIITEANNSSEGTRMPRARWDYIERLEYPIPRLPEQRAIAKILSDLDSKAELNQGMNKTLEAIEQAIFKRWFVDFEFPNEEGKPYKSSGGKMVYNEVLDKEIPAGWHVEPIDEIADFLNGLALQKFPARDGEEYLPVIKIRELRQGVTESSDKANLEVPREYIVNDGDILFSWSGSLEVVIWGFGKGALNQHLFKVTSSKYPKWFVYQWIVHYLPEYRQIAAGKATTMGHIQRHHLTASQVTIPDSKTLERMDHLLAPILERISRTKIETRILSEIRDSLLPKLMSGKIRVPILKEKAEDRDV